MTDPQEGRTDHQQQNSILVQGDRCIPDVLVTSTEPSPSSPDPFRLTRTHFGCQETTENHYQYEGFDLPQGQGIEVLGDVDPTDTAGSASMLGPSEFLSSSTVATMANRVMPPQRPTVAIPNHDGATQPEMVPPGRLLQTVWQAMVWDVSHDEQLLPTVPAVDDGRQEGRSPSANITTSRFQNDFLDDFVEEGDTWQQRINNLPQGGEMEAMVFEDDLVDFLVQQEDIEEEETDVGGTSPPQPTAE